MKTHKITLIPGDGVGPELAEAAKKCIEATGVSIEWDIQDAGIDVMAKEGTPLPDRVLESIRKNKIAIKSPITTPVGTGFRSVNVALRKELDLYACLRPCKSYPGVRGRYHNIDLVIVRENTEDFMPGLNFKKGPKSAPKLSDTLKGFLKEKSGPIPESASSRFLFSAPSVWLNLLSNMRANIKEKKSRRFTKPTS